MDRKIEWGVIGSGGIARRRTIPEGLATACNAKLKAVYDVDSAANNEVAGRFGATASASIDELLSSKVDAVYIATPAYIHCEQVIRAAEEGKSVLCEKPLGMSIKEAEDMMAACRKAGVQLGTAFMMRFQSQHQAALQLVRDARLGKLTYGRAQLSCWYPPIPGAWRQDLKTGGGGSLIDMGGHCIDLLEMFFGTVKRATCFTRNLVQRYEAEDSALAVFEFPSGAVATVDTYFCIPDSASKNSLEIYGSRGSILAKGTIGQGSRGEMIAWLSGGNQGYDAQQGRVDEDGLIISPAPVNIYQAEIEEFSRALLEGRQSSLSGIVGLQSQRVLAACYESARLGCAVDVN